MNIIEKYFKKHSNYGDIHQDKKRQYGLGITGILLFICAWAAGGYAVFSKPEFKHFSGFLPGPTLESLLGLSTSLDFWHAVAASLRRVFIGILVAFSIGFPFGILIGFYKNIRILTYPPIQLLRMVSPLSWMPIALLIFASFEGAIYFLITMATVWPIMINTTLGVSRVNPRWLMMAKNQGARDSQLIWMVIIPASVPYILTSLRLALGVAWIVLVPAEFLGISSGLGYLINDARDTMEYDRLMAIIIAIGIIGFILDSLIQLIRKYLDWIWPN